MLRKNFLLSLSLSVCCFALSANSQMLPEVLAEAYRTNPTLQSSKNYLQSVDENVAIAKSGYRPNVALQGGYAHQNIDSDSAYSGKDGSQDTVGVKASQPLFSGFQTVNAVKASKYTVEAAQNDFYNIEQSVLLDASSSYLSFLRDASIVKLQENNENLLKQKLDETQKRFDVGEVTRTDVSQSKARHSKAIADTINAKGNLEATKASYVQIIGSVPGALSEPTFIKALLPVSLDDALGYAKDNNFSVRQARANYAAQTYNVAQKAGALLPSVSLDASAARTNSDTNALATGKIKTDALEVGVNMSVPLYEAGADRAKLRQSKYQKASAADDVLTTVRQAVADTTSAYELMRASKAQLEAIDSQISANQLALDGVQKEEALGNRTILDVLDAYQELLNSEVQKESAKANYYQSSIKLLLAMGKFTASDLSLDVKIYDPKDNYKKTQNKWLSTSTNKD